MAKKLRLVLKKKILIISECFYPEAFKVNDLAFSWRDKGYDVSVLTQVPSYPEGVVYKGFKNKLYQKEILDGITIYRVHATTGYKSSLFKKLLKYFSFMFFGTIISIFIGKKFDYIFGFNMSALTGMVPAVTVKKLYKKPLTFWALDIWPDSVYAYGFKKTKVLELLLNAFVKKMYHNVDHIAISSRGFEEKLASYSKKNQKFHYLPNWADDLDDNKALESLGDSNKTHFTFAGNIGKVQNLDTIIDAFLNLDDQELSKAQLNIIGDGSHLESLMLKTTANNIVFHGRKPREDMIKYYKASDFLIVSLIDKPIFSLTVPAKTQTYIAAKKPLMGFINGEAAKVISENNLGYTSSPSETNAITNVMKKAINSTKEERAEFIKNSQELLDTVFNKEKIIDKMTNLLISDIN